jgi:hypothetical protein
MSDTNPISNEGPICHQQHAEQVESDITIQVESDITVICPKHGEHIHAIVSNIEGHEGAWCQICWLESLGPSLPYKK